MTIIDRFGLPCNERKPPFDEIRFVVIHYTATETLEEALGKMAIRDVSAHYAIDVDGTVYRLVPEEKRAWHVKTGCHWRGVPDVNSASIGIELVNVGIERADEGISPRPFAELQIAALKALLADIRSRRGRLELLGHSDADPDRKLDPGPLFPWGEFDPMPLVEEPLTESGISAGILARRLASLGYDARSPLAFSSFLLRWAPELWNDAVAALSRRTADTPTAGILPLKAEFAQSANTRGHPQEDAVLCDPENSIFAVCDGITRSSYTTGEPSPAKVVADLFAKTLRVAYAARGPRQGTRGRLAASVREASRAVAAWNAEHLPRHGGEDDYLSNDLAGLVFVAAAIDGRQACIAQIGDCWADLLRGGGCVRLTNCGTERVAEFRKAGGVGRETTLRIRRDIRNNATTDTWSRWRYGAVTGEPRGLWFVEWRMTELRPGDVLFLGTDGLAPFWESHGRKNGNVDTLKASTARTIIAAARTSCDDDKTLLRIDVG